MTSVRDLDFIDGTEAGADGFLALVHRALELRQGAKPKAFPGQHYIGVYLNASLRTRVSTEVAAHDLGMHGLSLQPGQDAWKMEHRAGVVMDQDKPEHYADALPVLAEYAQILGVRAFAGLSDASEDRADPVLAAFRKWAPAPVVNLESALWHPLQALADAATWTAHLGALRGQPIAVTWTPHPRAVPAAVPNQILLTAALLGANITVAHPDGFDLDPQIVERSRKLAADSGGSVQLTDNPDQAMKGARVVHAKAWSGFSGYGRREEEAKIRPTLKHWTLDGKRFGQADKAAGFMHCLPMRRNVEATDDVLESGRSWITETAGLRRWTATALFESILTRRGTP